MVKKNICISNKILSFDEAFKNAHFFTLENFIFSLAKI